MPTSPLTKIHDKMEGITSKQEAVLVAKLYGATDAGAARTAGVRPTTVYNWKKTNPKFRELYNEVVSGPLEFARDQLEFTTAKALDKIARMLDHPDPRVAMFAIDKIIAISGVANHTKRQEITVNNREEVDDVIRQLRARQIDVVDGSSGGSS